MPKHIHFRDNPVNGGNERKYGQIHVAPRGSSTEEMSM